MRISEIHSAMVEMGTIAEGPLTDSRTGQRRMQNRGVAREWRNMKRVDALSRDSKTLHTRTKAHRLRTWECCPHKISGAVKTRKNRQPR